MIQPRLNDAMMMIATLIHPLSGEMNYEGLILNEGITEKGGIRLGGVTFLGGE